MLARSTGRISDLLSSLPGCEMTNNLVVLWLQFAYFVWQFVRVAKYCRIPYALLAHTFMWLIGRWSPGPFAWHTFLVLETGREKYYVGREGAESILADCQDRSDRFRAEATRPAKDFGSDLAVISIPAVNYQLCIRESRINESFVWNYLRDEPDCFAREAELLLPSFAILDRTSDLTGLKMTCHGGFIPSKRIERALVVPDRERELNQNFMRLLSAIPLMVHALGHEKTSVWISVAVIVVDQLSQVFCWAWELALSYLPYLFMVPTHFRPQTRDALSTLSSILSKRLQYSDQVRKSLIHVRPGDVVYTPVPFNLADFEQIIDRPFKRERKTPVPFSEEKFGKYTLCARPIEIDEGLPVLTHHVAGSKIDSIFKSDGSFYNFRDNEHLHFGIWMSTKGDSLDCGDSKETKNSDVDPQDNFNNFQDLLQVMEELQMLPFIQTDKKTLRSLDFNEFVRPGRSLKDLTFLVAKKSAIIGG